MDTSFNDLLNEIRRHCEDKGIEVSIDFIAFLVSLVSLGLTSRPTQKLPPQQQQQQQREDEPSNEMKILSSVIEKLLDQSRPSLVTLKIQFHFAKRYRDRGYVVKKWRARLAQKTAPLSKEICDTSELDNAREIERLYQKILVVITLSSGLGDPTVPAVLSEVAIALQSVLQPSELPRFVVLSGREKDEQLTELGLIVAGIRLFNRDCRRGGEGIDDLPSVLQTGLSATRSSIIQLLESLMENVYNFTAAVEAAIRHGDASECDDEPKFNDVTWFIEMLVATRQLEIYVRKLLTDLESCEEETRSLIIRLQSSLLQLHETVKYRTAVPINKVYPLFKEIAEIWMKLQDEVIVLNHVNELLFELQELFPKKLNCYYQKALKKMLCNVKVLTDAERLEQTMGKTIVDCGECSVFYPNCEANFDKLNLQFLGFCAWSFVAGRGALIPGNPNIGVAEWRGKCFVFSCAGAASQFGSQPDRYWSAALEIARSKPEYVHLFQLFNELQILNYRERSSSEERCCTPFRPRQHQEVQTETHIVPTFIDKDYTSSLWKLREQALHFATICRCATRSTQTFKSHFRSAISLQTSIPKEKEVQTMKNSGSNTQPIKKYRFGLRGNKTSEQYFNCMSDK